MTITQVKIAGSDVDLENIDGQVLVSHGRNDITAPNTPGLCELLLLGSTSWDPPPVALGDTLTVKAHTNHFRFTGNVTDMTLSHQADGHWVLAVTGIGALARLSRLYDGEAGFAADTLANRVDEILTNTGLTYVAAADPDINLNAYDPNYASAADLLAELAEWTGATLFDTPDGEIRWQSYTRRGYTYSAAIWSDFLTDTWADVIGSWATQSSPSSTAPTPVELPAGAVVWEPIWRSNDGTILNDVTVTYGTADPQLTQQVTDATSIALFDRRATEITTGLANDYDALRRATNVITAQGSERWQVTNVQVIMNELTNQQRDDVYALLEGDRVLLTGLPQPTPNATSQFLGVVEGWTEEFNGDLHTLAISLSDPRYSYAVVSWGEVPVAYTWGGVSGTLKWQDVILPEDLE